MACADSFGSELVALIPRLRIRAWSLTRHPADTDDLVQDTLTRAWKAQASFEPGSNLEAWALRILRNQFFSEKRRSWRQVDFDLAPNEDLVQPPSQDATLELDELRGALNGLTEDRRNALMLIGVVGWSCEDAAAACACASGTIKSRVSRARDDLRRTLHARLHRPQGGAAHLAAVVITDEANLLARSLAAKARRTGSPPRQDRHLHTE